MKLRPAEGIEIPYPRKMYDQVFIVTGIIDGPVPFSDKFDADYRVAKVVSPDGLNRFPVEDLEIVSSA